MQVWPMPAVSGQRAMGADLRGEVRGPRLLYPQRRPVLITIDFPLMGMVYTRRLGSSSNQWNDDEVV